MPLPIAIARKLNTDPLIVPEVVADFKVLLMKLAFCWSFRVESESFGFLVISEMVLSSPFKLYETDFCSFFSNSAWSFELCIVLHDSTSSETTSFISSLF